MTTNPVRGQAATLLGLLLVLASPIARAAGEQALVKQVTALDDAAAAAYTEGDFDKMQKYLLKASSLGGRTLGTQPVMARVYLHIGVLYVDGLDKRALGVKYFGKALTIRPDIELRSNMATRTVTSAFAEASRLQAGTNETPRTAPTTAARREVPTEKDRPVEKDQKVGREAAQAERRPAETGVAAERCRGSSEIADVKRQARDELDRLEKALSMAKDALAKERTDSEKFRKDKMELERALGEAKQRVTQLENDGKQKDKRAAMSMEREKKVNDATMALEKEKAEKDSLILETAQRIQELEKEKAEKDKQIAALTQREKRERDAREKLERDRQTVEAREHERKAWEERVRAERDQLEAGPPIPSRIPEPLHCAVPEEIQAGADLFVQCVAQPAIKAKTIVFYYRPPSSTVYNAVVMDPTRRGWSRAVITANKLNGKLLQYYAEVRDGSDSIAATNGKATSPNVATITSAKLPSR